MTVDRKLQGPGPEAAYRAKLASGSFEVQRCGDCGLAGFFPRVTCKHCGSPALAWTKPSGKGIVYSTTIVRRKAEDGGDYNVAVVELEEGPRMMTRIEELAPDQVRIGQRVRARMAGAAADTVVVFVPDGGGDA